MSDTKVNAKDDPHAEDVTQEGGNDIISIPLSNHAFMQGDLFFMSASISNSFSVEAGEYKPVSEQSAWENKYFVYHAKLGIFAEISQVFTQHCGTDKSFSTKIVPILRAEIPAEALTGLEDLLNAVRETQGSEKGSIYLQSGLAHMSIAEKSGKKCTVFLSVNPLTHSISVSAQINRQSSDMVVIPIHDLDQAGQDYARHLLKLAQQDVIKRRKQLALTGGQ